jgi:hypothetical protein
MNVIDKSVENALTAKRPARYLNAMRQYCNSAHNSLVPLTYY